jgi:hypothetical protein
MQDLPHNDTNIADLGTLCRALGFLAVAMRRDKLQTPGGAERAEKLAKLIEEFCRLPDTTSTVLVALPKTSAAQLGAWVCEHLKDRSVIRHTHNDTVIEVRGSASARTAEQIMQAVNDNSRKDALIKEMSLCLESCMEVGSLDWDTEQNADVLVKRAKATH